MKKIIITILSAIALLLGPALVAGQSLTLGDGNINTLDQWTSTTTPASAIIPRSATKDVRIPKLGSTGNPCLKVSTNGTIATTTCGGAGSSPLTTKGDVYTYTSTDARLPVGTNGTVLTASSSAASGLAWTATSSLGILYPQFWDDFQRANTATGTVSSAPTGHSYTLTETFPTPRTKIFNGQVRQTDLSATTTSASYLETTLAESPTFVGARFNWTPGPAYASYDLSGAGYIFLIGTTSPILSNGFVHAVCYRNQMLIDVTDNFPLNGLTRIYTGDYYPAFRVDGSSVNASVTFDGNNAMTFRCGDQIAHATSSLIDQVRGKQVAFEHYYGGGGAINAALNTEGVYAGHEDLSTSLYNPINGMFTNISSTTLLYSVQQSPKITVSTSSILLGNTQNGLGSFGLVVASRATTSPNNFFQEGYAENIGDEVSNIAKWGYDTNPDYAFFIKNTHGFNVGFLNTALGIRWGGYDNNFLNLKSTGAGQTQLGINTSNTVAPITLYGDFTFAAGDSYLNFNNTAGSSGYGLRESSGVMQYKNSGGAWNPFSPLTTKGDIFAYSTTSTRFPVGSNGQVIVASSTAPTGLAWIATSSLGISSGGGTPASPDGGIQYNDNGSFGATSTFTWATTTAQLLIATSSDPAIKYRTVINGINQGVCSGTAEACDILNFPTEGQCNGQLGCTAVNAGDCNDYNADETTCTATGGCTYDNGDRDCSDASGTDQTTCEDGRSGCTWSDPDCTGTYNTGSPVCNGNFYNTCTGTETQCDAITNSTDCTGQATCDWGSTYNALYTDGEIYANSTTTIGANFLVTGNSGFGTLNPIRSVDIRKPNVNPNTTESGTMAVITTDPYNTANAGGSIAFGGVYAELTDTIAWAVIKGDKETAGYGEADGRLNFYTRNGNTTLKMTINSNGHTMITGNQSSSVNAASWFDVYGNVSVGSGYAGATAAPANGLIVEGKSGFGTSTPAAGFAIKGIAGSSPFLVASSSNSRMFEINQSAAALFNNSAGTAGQILQSNGSTAAPTWVATSTVLSTTRITATTTGPTAGIGNTATLTVNCTTGLKVQGGGGSIASNANGAVLQNSYPASTTAWTVDYYATLGVGAGGTITGYAICQ